MSSFKMRTRPTRPKKADEPPKSLKEDETQRRITLCEKIRNRKLLWKASRSNAAQKLEVDKAWRTAAAQANFEVADAKSNFASIKKCLLNQINTAIQNGAGTWAEVIIRVNAKFKNTSPPEYWMKLQWLAKELAEEALAKNIPMQPPGNENTGSNTDQILDFVMDEAGFNANIVGETVTVQTTVGTEGMITNGNVTQDSNATAKKLSKPKKSTKTTVGNPSQDSNALPHQYNLLTSMNPIQIKMETEDDEQSNEGPQQPDPLLPQQPANTASKGPGEIPPLHQQQQQDYSKQNEEILKRKKELIDKLTRLYVDNLGQVSSNIADLVTEMSRNHLMSTPPSYR